MIATLERLLVHYGPWALLPIFVIVVLESSAFVGLIAPGEVTALIAGALAAARAFHFSTAFAVVAGGAIVGDLAGYALGRFKGDALLARWDFARRHYERHRGRIEAYFKRWGSATVVVGRFVAVGRAFTPFAAGLYKMPPGRFLAMAVIGGLLWGLFTVGLGYLLASNLTLLETWLRSISAGIVIFLVLSIAMVMAWRWAAAHQDKIIAGWRLRAQRYGINLEPYVDFIRARFSPSGYLGLHFTVGLISLGAMGWLFGSVAQDIFAQDPLVHVDLFVAAVVADLHAPALDKLAALAVLLGNWGWLIIVVAAAAAGSALAGDWTAAIAAAPALGGAYALANAMQLLFAGFAPNVPAAKVVHGFYGFPSIALTAATAAYGTACYAVARYAGSWRLQTLAVAVALYLVMLVGLGELYKGQLLSAAIGGFALGGFWLAICLTGVLTYDRLSGRG
jgi:membrane protein DedA with SNARE-associated domain